MVLDLLYGLHKAGLSRLGGLHRGVFAAQFPLDLIDPVLRRGMSLGETGIPRFQVFSHHHEHLHQPVRVIAQASENGLRGIVGAVFERTGVAAVDHVRDVRDCAAESFRKLGHLVWRQHSDAFRGDRGQGVGDPRFFDGLYPVLELDVSDLVGQYCGYGILIAAAAEESPGDEDMPARRGEGIDLVGVQNEKTVTAENLRHVRDLGQGLAEEIQIFVGRLVRIGRILGQDDRRHGPADVILLLGCELLNAFGNGAGAFLDRLRSRGADRPDFLGLGCHLCG